MTAAPAVADLGARRRRGDAAIAAVAAAPVAHVPVAFLDALTCREPRGDGVPLRTLRVVSAG